MPYKYVIKQPKSEVKEKIVEFELHHGVDGIRLEANGCIIFVIYVSGNMNTNFDLVKNGSAPAGTLDFEKLFENK